VLAEVDKEFTTIEDVAAPCMFAMGRHVNLDESVRLP
jgi:hypothetical protein